MNNKFIIKTLLAIFSVMMMPSCKTAAPQSGDLTVDMATTAGNVRLLIYGDTPLHRANFEKLVREGYYDGVLFHRVIDRFMIQTGDCNSRNAAPGELLGEGDVGYRIDAEFVYPKHFHKRGAVAAAREGDDTNPEKQSSGAQFYIVTGLPFTAAQLDAMDSRRVRQQEMELFDRLRRERRDELMALRRNRDSAGVQALLETLSQRAHAQTLAHPDTLTAEQRDAYMTVGGTPHLDGSYTVFGEVVEGMEVVDAIQRVKTDANDRPIEDVRILKMTVVE